ncbi:hypothetical protein F751_5345 [Auxenochlorella protothecoides]|uniref:Uncharacterized protein n=1 Tax=Auxenochlorella protothecoides TaxID=3075 RepID=A0A087SRS8_AUXPR|nr:hypothetical protein F751_5345 [Auxenochlorella protothecoides]KFM28432.1 hypothetical protein F751_5345 [Auxenochlorella protothecoides]
MGPWPWRAGGARGIEGRGSARHPQAPGPDHGGRARRRSSLHSRGSIYGTWATRLGRFRRGAWQGWWCFTPAWCNPVGCPLFPPGIELFAGGVVRCGGQVPHPRAPALDACAPIISLLLSFQACLRAIPPPAEWSGRRSDQVGHGSVSSWRARAWRTSPARRACLNI